MAESYEFDVFLSHNNQDKPRVQKLAKRLRKAGVRVWFDEWVIQPGDDIFLQIERGLESSRTLVLCMSPAAFGSDWVGLERNTILFRDPANHERRFIPLLLADCEIPDTIRRFHYIDYRQPQQSAFKTLLTACQAEAPTATPPIPPPNKKAKTSKPLATLERTLKGHTSWVPSVAVSPDGKWVVSGSWDKTVKIWDMETGKCRATLAEHKNEVRSVAITPDGERILSASTDQTIRVWDVQSGHQQTICNDHTRTISSVASLSYGQRALSGSWDHTLKLWNIASGQCLKTVEGLDSPVLCVAVTKDGQHAVSGDRAGKLKHWNLETGQCLATLHGHADIVNSVQITPDGRHAVSGSDDKTVKLWDLETGSCIGTFEGHQHGVDSVALSPDGTLIASAGNTDWTIRLWELQSGACLQVIETNKWPISVAFSPDGSRLVVGTAWLSMTLPTNSNIYIYNLTGLKAAQPIEKSARYMNAKVVLVGESGVGKSGLAHRLMEDKFVKTASTHGMQVWRLDLPFKKQDNLEREVLLWDLAGQEDYRLIHQLFLEETALALMLFNPQKDDPFAEVGDWIKALKMAVASKDNEKDNAREAVKLLIAARTDVGTVQVSQKKIDRFLKEYGFAAYLATSSKSGDNCSDQESKKGLSALKQLIAKHIPWNTLPWTSTPRLLRSLKNAVLAMKKQDGVRLLRFTELVQRLKQTLADERFDEAQARTAITLLANHGLARSFEFGDLVLLEPEILNGYASAVIQAARAHTDEIGCVSEQEVFEGKINLDGVDRLTPADETLLLRAMVQTFLNKSLCIAEETPEGRQLIFPSQYRRERSIPDHPEIFVSYTFSGELATIYTTLVVRLWYSREFDNRELWNNAAEFSTSKGKIAGVLLEKRVEGEGKFSVFFESKVPDELKVVFIHYMHQHLHRYAHDVRRDRRYVCEDCHTPVTDLEIVRKRLEAKKTFIYCQNCDEKVPLIDHIEQQLASDPVAREVLKMEQVARRELDSQALEQILMGHMLAICGEANQIFRPVSLFDQGIDGEVEFKDNDGKASGQKIYVQLKSGDSHLRQRQGDGKLIFDVKNPRHLDYWVQQPVDVFLVIRDAEGTIRWMNVSHYLKTRKNKKSRQIVFTGEKLHATSLWHLRDAYIPRVPNG